MKIFISQPMMGKSDELISAERKLIIERVKSMYGNDVEILDSLFNDYNTSDIKRPPVAFLGKSLEVLAQADVAFFSSGWKSARGCRIEYDVARLYGIRVTGDESCSVLILNRQRLRITSEYLWLRSVSSGILAFIEINLTCILTCIL